MYYDVPTKFGLMALTPTEANHIYITHDAQDGRASTPITIRGILYRASAHVYRYPDGKWRVGAPTSAEYQRPREAYMSFAEFRQMVPSRPAKKAFIEEVERVVNRWASRNAPKIHDAEQDHIQTQIDRLAREVEVMETELKKKKDVLLALERSKWIR